MAERPIVYAAARNNAEWCDAFCCTYGIAGRFDAECWTSPERTPPLYPDSVTLVPGVAATQLLSAIDTSDGCSVKDSFADLDLTSDGFRVLFRGTWLVRAPGDAAPASSRWLVIETQEQLEEWESAWRVSPGGPAFFRPALLADAASPCSRDTTAVGSSQARSQTEARRWSGSAMSSTRTEISDPPGTMQPMRPRRAGDRCPSSATRRAQLSRLRIELDSPASASSPSG